MARLIKTPAAKTQAVIHSFSLAATLTASIVILAASGRAYAAAKEGSKPWHHTAFLSFLVCFVLDVTAAQKVCTGGDRFEKAFLSLLLKGQDVI